MKTKNQKKMIEIYLTSFHRPNNMLTAKWLQKVGYDMNKVTVFIDDEAGDTEEYKKACKEFGCHLHVFSEKESRKRYDYVHRANKFCRSAGQAWNMMYDYAKDHGVDFYCVIDDDTTHYEIKVLGRYNFRRMANLNDFLWQSEVTEKFMRKRHIGVFAWSQNGDFIDPVNKYIFRKKAMNTTFYLLPYIYRGSRGYGDEDTSLYTTLHNQGLFVGSYGCGCSLHPMPSAKQAGGFTDIYQSCKLLSKAILCPIQYPSAIKATKQPRNGHRLHHLISYRYLMPKILKGDGTVDNIPWDTYPEDYPFTNEPKRITNDTHTSEIEV